jgi:hypothetical protein
MVRATGILSPAKIRDGPRRQWAPRAIAEISTRRRLKAAKRLSIRRLGSVFAQGSILKWLESYIDSIHPRLDAQSRHAGLFEGQHCRNTWPRQNAFIVQAAVRHSRSVDIEEIGAAITPKEVDVR